RYPRGSAGIGLLHVHDRAAARLGFDRHRSGSQALPQRAPGSGAHRPGDFAQAVLGTSAKVPEGKPAAVGPMLWLDEKRGSSACRFIETRAQRALTRGASVA